MSLTSEREKAWRDILTESAFALGRDMLTGYALTAAIHAFERLNSDVPTKLLPEIYVRSMKLTDESGAPIYWDARAFSLAYRRYCEQNEGRNDLDESRLLPDKAAAACKRCFGKGLEFMLGGGVRPGCKHEPLTEEDEREFEEAAKLSTDEIREQIEHARKAMSMKPNVGRVPVATKEQPKGKVLVCDWCGHVYDTYFHPFNVGDECGYLLDRHTDPNLCKGKLTLKPEVSGGGATT